MNTTFFVTLGVATFFAGCAYGYFSNKKSEPKPLSVQELWDLEKEAEKPINRMKQEMEDNKHYRSYESQLLIRDMRRLSDESLKTKIYIGQNPGVLDNITQEELEKQKSEYEHYLIMCEKLNVVALNEKEFALKEKTVWLMSFEMIIFSPISSCYMIYDQETARYAGGNMMEKMKEEFKIKNY